MEKSKRQSHTSDLIQPRERLAADRTTFTREVIDRSSGSNGVSGASEACDERLSGVCSPICLWTGVCAVKCEKKKENMNKTFCSWRMQAAEIQVSHLDLEKACYFIKSAECSNIKQLRWFI